EVNLLIARDFTGSATGISQGVSISSLKALKARRSDALILEDGHLTLEEIIRLDLPKAQFAFLSACQTTTGDEKLSEEAVHIAGGMLLAGFMPTWFKMDKNLIVEVWQKHSTFLCKSFVRREVYRLYLGFRLYSSVSSSSPNLWVLYTNFSLAIYGTVTVCAVHEIDTFVAALLVTVHYLVVASLLPVARAQTTPSWTSTPFNPAAYPLAVRSPYLSCWLLSGPGLALNEDWPHFWTGS
ncbi:1071_t:CDS:2, partial [Acaulospora colombiana]